MDLGDQLNRSHKVPSDGNTAAIRTRAVVGDQDRLGLDGSGRLDISLGVAHHERAPEA
jgi:hypothetical protein